MARDAFLIYVDDWLSSGRIELMDAIEERGYFRLLLRAWKQHDCGLPTDDLTLAAWSKMGTQWFRETADRNLRVCGVTSGQKVRECFIEKDGRLYSERQLREREYQEKVAASRKESGRMGGRPRKASGNQNESKEKANEKQNETKRFSDSKANEKQNETNLVSGLGLRFNNKEKTLELDELWVEFSGLAKQFWLDLIPEDLASWRFPWGALDFEGKALAVQRLKERLAAGQDYRKVFKPTYFTRGEFKREVPPSPANARPANPAHAPYRDPFADALRQEPK